MGTNADLDEVETTRTKAEHTVRSAIAGHPQGGVRRIVLYLIAYAAVLVAYAAPDLLAFIGLTWALLAFTLLATTDQLL